MHQTIHTEYGVNHKFVSFARLFSLFGSAAPTAWHTYTIEKTPNRIEMWVDGKVSSVFTPATAPWFAKYYETGRRWSLLMNLQVGGGLRRPRRDHGLAGRPERHAARLRQDLGAGLRPTSTGSSVRRKLP